MSDASSPKNKPAVRFSQNVTRNHDRRLSGEQSDICIYSSRSRGKVDEERNESIFVSKNRRDVRITTEDYDASAPEQRSAFEKQGIDVHARASLSQISKVFSFLRRYCPGHDVSVIVHTQLRAQLRDLKNFIYQIKDYIPDPRGRTITLNLKDRSPQIERITRRPYVSNEIRSSRYTIYNFLPRQLLFQFSKIANIYFLAVSILQMIPGLSTTGSYTTIVPLGIFICIAMAREGYDDYRRYRLDTVENGRTTLMLKIDGHTSDLQSQTVKWRNVAVGDLLRLSKDDCVPADVILLRSEEPNNAAYVETAALDGETNLKAKTALPEIYRKCEDHDLVDFQFSIHSEAPNPDLYKYEGRISFDGLTLPLTNDQIIYRGSILRNTSSVKAVVIFTGEETKIRMNASKHIRIKRPSMQSRVNKIVLVIVAFVLSLSVFCTCGYYLWHSHTGAHLWYLDSATSISFVPIFVSFLILFNTMVPLSLYVSMEIIKGIQQILLELDIDLYHEDSNTPAEARTSTINEELGQIGYIFSDKTGTLTNNEMVFRRISVAGHNFVHDLDIQMKDISEPPFLLHRARKGKNVIVKRSKTTEDYEIARPNALFRRLSLGNSTAGRKFTTNKRARKSNSSFKGTKYSTITDLHTTTEMLQYVQKHPHTLFARRARLFLLSIALCHTVIPDRTRSGDIPHYSAASPDELALVSAAQELGYILSDRDAQTVTLKIYPNGLECSPMYEVYTILDVLEFSSDRKRMSIIVRFPDDRHCIMCKGADSFMLEILRLKALAKEKLSEVNQMNELRKSLEADRVLARRSMARPSLSRPSMSGRTRLDMIRDLDYYLDNRREDDGHIDDISMQNADQYRLRHSYAFGETMHPLERNIDLIDEQLARNESVIISNTFQHLFQFASEGLRVLLYGHRFITSKEYQAWKHIYRQATTAFENRQVKIEQAARMIEVDLELTGATAIEDKLQDGVPQSIEKFRRAGIKIWMLTGDKRETAINIGHSAGLIKDYSAVTILEQGDSNLREIMATTTLSIAEDSLAHSVVVLDGATLSHIESDASLLSLLMELITGVDTVVCCRASPAQKASLVRSVRKKVQSAITLAIGDGANDIAMIQEAHVGIGITGKEGMQAARSSDYSIAQFRFLVKLLLVHGRWNYIR